MTTSKKDYTAVAAAIKAQRAREEYCETPNAVSMALDALADDLAVYFAGCGPAFKRNRFLTACGVKSC